MIDYDDAVDKILVQSKPIKPQTIGLEAALGYVLAEDVRAKSELPRFDSSAVDGYAVLASDCMYASEEPVTLKLVGTAFAGNVSKDKLRSGNAIRILTGAVVPTGTDAVVMQEETVLIGNQVLIKQSIETGQNIRRCGEEFAKDDLILSKGTMITPSVIALLITGGYLKVHVYRKPRIAILVTGDEVRTVGQKLSKGAVYDSNSPGLDAALRAIGITPIKKTILKDQPTVIRQALVRALDQADIVLTTGGVSVGDRDYVRPTLDTIGVKCIYWSVAMKPGKPNYFGVYGKKLVFGLPGNPVSVMLSFFLLVKPGILKMMGLQESHPYQFTAILGSSIKKQKGRMEFVRAQLERKDNGKLIAKPLQGRDSHMLGSLAKANSVIHFPKDATKMEKGEKVNLTLLQWGVI
jgi:molybdopterin molybdotransferase